ncbi:MAG: hypothetical protein AB1758_29670, partial [Candidatus Eremiobacterota bacterium]
TLNPVELSPDFLHRVLEWAAALPALRGVSLDSREAFVTSQRVREAARALGAGRFLHPILGLESARESVRNLVLDKRMSDGAIRRAFSNVAAVAREGLEASMDCNVVLGGLGTSAGDAVADAVETGRFAFDLGRASGLVVDLNLHPYYPSERGRSRFPQHGRCSLNLALRAVEGLDALRRELSPRSRLFIGWQDEGHDQDQEVRRLELSIARASFERFNRTQDWQALRACRSRDTPPG